MLQFQPTVYNPLLLLSKCYQTFLHVISLVLAIGELLDLKLKASSSSLTYSPVLISRINVFKLFLGWCQ